MKDISLFSNLFFWFLIVMKVMLAMTLLEIILLLLLLLMMMRVLFSFFVSLDFCSPLLFCCGWWWWENEYNHQMNFKWNDINSMIVIKRIKQFARFAKWNKKIIIKNLRNGILQKNSRFTYIFLAKNKQQMMMKESRDFYFLRVFSCLISFYLTIPEMC